MPLFCWWLVLVPVQGHVLVWCLVSLLIPLGVAFCWFQDVTIQTTALPLLLTFLPQRRCLQSVPLVFFSLVAPRCCLLFAPQAFCGGSAVAFFWSSCLLFWLVEVVFNHFSSVEICPRWLIAKWKLSTNQFDLLI
jgi:hypothetical protein